MTIASGFYIGTNEDLLATAEQWLGTSVDFLQWNTGKASWADWIGSIGWSVGKLSDITVPIHWSIPLFAKEGNLTDAAAHAYDDKYVAAAKELAATVPDGEKIMIRVGEEFNGNWMGWSAAGKEALFAQAYRNFVDAFRSVSDKFVFEWNFSVAVGGTDIKAAYPGDAYVDYIGGDLYWDGAASWSTIKDPAKAWNYYKTQPFGLDWLANFAAQHGKPIGFSEWGVDTDNASSFITNFYNWMQTHDVAYQSYWNSNAAFLGKLYEGQYPTVAATFISLFGVNTITDESLDAQIVGLDGQDAISALTGNHLIGGGGGGDVILVGDGNNHIYGNLPTAAAGATDGADTITAGLGSNYINGNAGDDVITVGAGGSTGANRVQGGQGNDTITILGGGSNAANGNLGDDTITAADATGNNRLRGGQGNDLIVAGHGHDQLMGDIGNDTLRAGTGADHITIMTGGSGSDTFDFAAAGSGTVVPIGSAYFFQEVTDFLHGTDHLAIGHTLADGAVHAATIAGFAGADAAIAYARQILTGTPNDVAAIQVGGDTYVAWASGGGEIDSVVKLDGVRADTVTASDFV